MFDPKDTDILAASIVLSEFNEPVIAIAPNSALAIAPTAPTKFTSPPPVTVNLLTPLASEFNVFANLIV